MHEFCDECPYTTQEQQQRLRTVKVLSEAGIPCLVHGEDALAFVHWVPVIPSALQVVVPKQDMERAKDLILGADLPFRLFTGIDNYYNESIFADPARSRIYPNAIYLERTLTYTCSADYELYGEHPNIIIIHPEDDFNVNVADYSRSVALPPFPDNIRFPTKTAFLDSVIETRLDPSCGQTSSRLIMRFATWIEYVIDYCIRSNPLVLPNGDLAPEAEALTRSLRPENQPQMDAMFRKSPQFLDIAHHRNVRREILRKLGKIELADRPLPRFPPGNREFINALVKERAAKEALLKAQADVQSNPRALIPKSSGQSRSFSTSAIAMGRSSGLLRLAQQAMKP